MDTADTVAFHLIEIVVAFHLIEIQIEFLKINGFFEFQIFNQLEVGYSWIFSNSKFSLKNYIIFEKLILDTQILICVKIFKQDIINDMSIDHSIGK